MAEKYNFGMKIARSCKRNSIAYLFLIVIEIVIAVVSGVYFSKYIQDVIQFAQQHSNDQVNNVATATQLGENFYNDFFGPNGNDFYVFFIMVIAAAIFGLALIILEIVLVFQTHSFNKHFGSNKHLWILYLLGIVTIIPGICAAFMTISTSKYVLKHPQ